MRRSFQFVLISGLAFILDFIIYSLLTIVFHINVDISNIISSLCGCTLVFFTATKRIFETNESKISLNAKYFIYIIYQVIFIFTVSKIILFLKNYLLAYNIDFLTNYASIIVKVFITPFTLTINYFVMKYLTKY